MEGPIFSALVDIAAITGKAAAGVPVIPPAAKCGATAG